MSAVLVPRQRPWTVFSAILTCCIELERSNDTSALRREFRAVGTHWINALGIETSAKFFQTCSEFGHARFFGRSIALDNFNHFDLSIVGAIYVSVIGMLRPNKGHAITHLGAGSWGVSVRKSSKLWRGSECKCLNVQMAPIPSGWVSYFVILKLKKYLRFKKHNPPRG